MTVKCCGRLEDGTEIDRHDNLKLVLGDADFIDGEGVLMYSLLRTRHDFSVCEFLLLKKTFTLYLKTGAD